MRIPDGTRVRVTAVGIDLGTVARVRTFLPLSGGGPAYIIERQSDGLALCYYESNLEVIGDDNN